MDSKPTISGVINSALGHIISSKVAILKAAIIPFALLTALDYSSDLEIPFPVNIAISLLYLAVYTYFAVIIHRIILLGVDSVQEWGLPTWTKRETYFFIHLFALIILSAVIVFSLAFFGQAGIIIAYFVLAYIFIRLSLVFPASAIGDGVTFRTSWALTKKHQLLMLYILIIFPLILILPSYFITEMGGAFIINSTIDTVGTIIGISFLSITYRQIKLYEYSS